MRSRILINAANACIRRASDQAAHAAHLAMFEFHHAVTGHDGKRREVACHRANARGLADGYAYRALDYIKRV